MRHEVESLRRQRNTIDGPPSGESGEPDRNRPGVLVVDDDQLVRLMVRTGLERNGFDVWIAADADEAVEVYRMHTGRIAVVLLDVQMPGRDGPETLDALRELDPGVPVCFMSGDTGDYTADELTRRGATCFVPKPFLLNDLAETLRQVASRKTGEAVDAATATKSRTRHELTA